MAVVYEALSSARSHNNLVVGVLMLAQGLLTQGADPAYPLLLSVKNR